VYAFTSAKVYCLARRQRRMVAMENAVLGGSKYADVRKQQRNLLTLTLLTFAFAFCWAPIYLYLVLYTITNIKLHSYLKFIFQYMAYANSFLNWAIYFQTKDSSETDTESF